MAQRDANTRDWGLEAVRRQLAELMDSEPFRHAERQKRFLSYVVEEELAGRGEQINQYAIASDVFDRDASFDPAVDSVVRVEARRLRSKLSEYYAATPAPDQLVIALPKGHYRVQIASVPEATKITSGFQADRNERRGSAEVDTGPVVAVLPLDNLGGDPEQDYFSDGITEDIITDLSKVSGLSVISRHSTFVYKGRSVAARDIGEDLGARFLVEGSVRRSGQRVRINTQLIDALTDSHLWAERYDREIGDIFSVQDEVSRLIVGALKVTLTKFENQRLGHRGTQSVEAHDCVLKGMERFHQFTRDGIESATELLTDAINLDPSYADAHAWLGRVLIFAAITGLSDKGAETVAEAVDMARTATTIDPMLPNGHAVLGWALTWEGQDDEGLQETERALELDSSFADGYLWRAMALSASGRGEESLRTIERGMRLNPHYSVTYLHAVGLAHFALEDYDEALVQCRRGVRRNPNFLPNHLLEIASLAHLGRVEEAASAAAMASCLDPTGTSIARNFFNDPRLDSLYKLGLQNAGLRIR